MLSKEGRDSMSYDGKLKFDTKIDESGFNSGIGKLGSLAKAGIAVLATYVTSFAVLTKSALDEVASLEQNVGGIETLFGAGGKSLEEYAKSVGKSTEEAKGSYEKLMEAQTLALDNANKAYKTAGLSANEYMSTVTSFAASLKQSVSDEVEAAKAADQAVIDMSDNANKMGTSMELIQNAYQGFAKQNYTMLDNLKLGYGGTKTEMERLLKDAEKLSGVKYDINNLADVYQAIHVIQEELGITGTTAAEASSTIEGSMSSAKAAWDNFLAGVGSPEELAAAIDTVATVVVDNLSEIIPRLIETTPTLIKELIPTIIKLGPSLAEAGLSIMESFADGVMEIVPHLPAKAGEIVSQLINGIQENGPSMIGTAAELLAGFLEGIGAQLPELVPKALEMVVTIADAVITNIPTIVQAGISLLKGLIQGVVNALPTLIAEGPRIINDFCSAIYSAIGDLLLAGWEMIKSLVQGLWENRGLLFENAGEIFLAFLNIFSLSKLASLGKNLITNLVKGIKTLASNPSATLKEILNNAINAVKNMDWKNLGKNILGGIIEGIKKNASQILKTLVAAATSALDGVKKFLGIHSPSTVFRDQIGKNMALGVGVGFEKNIPVDNMADNMSNSVKRMQQRVSVVTREPVVATTSVTKSVSEIAQSSTPVGNKKDIVIHTHVELDGKEIGYSVTPYVDSNLSDDEDLKRRGN